MTLTNVAVYPIRLFLAPLFLLFSFVLLGDAIADSLCCYSCSLVFSSVIALKGFYLKERKQGCSGSDSPVLSS